MDYKGYKSQPLDFVTYQDGQDGINITAVTPQYALTRENTDEGEIQYYSTTSGWKGLTVETTVEKALASIQGDGQDAWWVGDGFETLLDEYWNTKDNAYPNTLWTREETKYSNETTTYSDPRKDAGGSAISQWCLDNDRTLINGAHIATGTVTAQQIDAGLLNAAGVVVTSASSSDTGLLKPPVEEAFDITTDVQPMPASGSYTKDDATNTYTLTLKDKHGGLRLSPAKFSSSQIYTLKFKFTDLYTKKAGAVPVTRLGGNVGYPNNNFKLLRATIDGSPVLDPSSYGVESSTGGYALSKDADHEYNIELEFIYLGMNNSGDIDNPNNYFYISPNRCLADPIQQTYTQITVTEISCVSRSVLQYIFIAQGSFIAPTEADPNWQNEFPEWEGTGSVWRRIVTEASNIAGEVIYNYSPAQLLTAGECARIMAETAIANGETWIDDNDNGLEKKITSLGEWCKKYNVTILDGSNLMTGTIDASEITVTNLDASQITTGTIDASEINVTNLDASNITAGIFTVGVDGPDEGKDLGGSEIVFQAGYGENNEPLVKIGGFEVDSNRLSSGGNQFIPGISVAGITKVFKVYTASNGTETHQKYEVGDIGTKIDDTSRFYNPSELPETIYSNIVDLDLQKATQSAPTIWTEFTGQLLIYTGDITADLDDDDNTETYNVWDKLYYKAEDGKWHQDDGKIWTNVIVIQKPVVYLGTDKIELTSGDSQFRVKDGEIFANAGTIGGFAVTADSLYSHSADPTTGITLSTAGGSIPVIRAGDNFEVSTKGEITAKAGTIGGWTINETALSAEKTSDPSVKVGLSVPQDDVDDNKNYVIWAGGGGGATSPFSVALDGTISINKGGLNLSTDAIVEKSTEGFLGIGKGEQINRATFVTQPAKSVLANNRRDEGSIPDYWVNTVCYGVRGVPDYVRGGKLDVEDKDADGNVQTFYAGGLTISSDSYTVHTDGTPDVGEAYWGKYSGKTAFIQAQANSRYQAYDSGAKLIVGEWNRPVKTLTDSEGVTIDKDNTVLAGIPSPVDLNAVYITPYTISGSNLGIIGESKDTIQHTAGTYTKRQITGAQDSLVGMCFRSGGGSYSDDWPWAIWAGNESTWGTKAFRVGHGGEVYIKNSLNYKGKEVYSLRYHIFSGVAHGTEASFNTGATIVAAVACRKQTQANSKNYAWSVNWGGSTIYATNMAGSGSDDLVVFYLV